MICLLKIEEIRINHPDDWRFSSFHETWVPGDRMRLIAIKIRYLEKLTKKRQLRLREERINLSARNLRLLHLPDEDDEELEKIVGLRLIGKAW